MSHFMVKAQLGCGSIIEIVQEKPNMNFTIKLIPPANIPVSDMAQIKDSNLYLRSTSESLVGVYQLLRLIIEGDKPKKKTFWQSLIGE